MGPLTSRYPAVTLSAHPYRLGAILSQAWKADASAALVRRLGTSPEELETTGGRTECPDIWELDNGDVAVVGQDLTQSYRDRLPPSLRIAENERLVVIPRATILAAKADLPDA